MATKVTDHPRVLMEQRRRAAKPRKIGNGGLTPRIKRALEVMVFGPDGDSALAPTSYKETAALAGITDRALRGAMNKPAVLNHYRALLKELREGQRAANIRTAIEVRDSKTLKESAAGERVRLLAAAQLDSDLQDSDHSPSTVNVNVVTPGYVIDLSAWPSDEDRGKAELERVIEHDAGELDRGDREGQAA